MAPGAHPDQLACVTISALLDDPPPLPGWTERAWRGALCRPHAVGALGPLLSDRRLEPLLRWVASQARPERHLPAVAAALAVLDAAVGKGGSAPLAVARGIEAAVFAARPLGARSRAQARMSPSASMERLAAAPSAPRRGPESPFLWTAARLLASVGFDLAGDASLAGRLVVALDVVLDHWMANARAGGGLPEFSSENVLRSD